LAGLRASVRSDRLRIRNRRAAYTSQNCTTSKPNAL
jgi:hypothetical protein